MSGEEGDTDLEAEDIIVAAVLAFIDRDEV